MARLDHTNLTLITLVATAAVSAQPVHETIGDGIVRSFASSGVQATAEPSVALVNGDVPGTPGVEAGFGPLPSFDFRNGLQTVVVQLDPGVNLYATGHQSGPFERTGRRVEYYNLDNFAWNDASNRNYQTHPWVLGVNPNGTAFGILFDSTWRSSLDLELPQTDGIIFQTEGPSPRVITVNADTPQGVVEALADLTGHPFMPPMWSVGYHQSKFSYFPQDNAFNTANEFRLRQIPAEVIWMDIDYMDNFKNFTFNPFAFPNPTRLNADLDSIDFQAVWMANCGIGADPNYDAFQQMQAQNLGVQRSNGTTFFGEVWPGNSVWPDFTMAQTREWWAGRIEDFASIGIDGIWNDMNEPAVFNVGSKTMPDDNFHRADADLGGPGPHTKYHNIYGMQMSRATREGMLRAFPDKRPFVLTRAGYIGGQRFAAMWTGDNVANWYHVDVSMQNTLNIGLSGQPNNGPDIGGFNGDSGALMYARWMGLGAMMPFARGHYGFASRDREPWSYGTQTENTSRLALNRRYRLLNYFYTQFYDAHTTGLPVCRPLFFAEPANPDLREYDDGFLVGPGLLVVGATKPGAVPQLPPFETPVYRFGFPESDAPGAPSDLSDSDLPDLYALGGHIVIANPLVQSSRELAPRRDEALELIIGLDEDGFATGTLYEDAGDGWDFQTDGFNKLTFTAQQTNGSVTVDLANVEGSLQVLDRPITVRFLLGDTNEVTVHTSLNQLPVSFPAATPTPDQQPDPALIDGRLIRDNFGQANRYASNDAPRFSEISQLRTLYARAGDDALELGIEGELAIDGTAIAIFIDAEPGGQNFVNTSALNPPPSGLQGLTGTLLEPGFFADKLLFANAFDGSIFVDWVNLEGGSNGSKTYLGQGFVGSGNGNLSGGNNLGIEVALGSAGHVARSGFEIRVPYSQLGTGTGPFNEIKVFAAVVKTNAQITNQTLPKTDDAWPSFTPNFGSFPGRQYVSVLNDPDLTGDGEWDFFDAIDYLRLFDAGDPAADIANPTGAVDNADLLEFIAIAFPLDT